MPTSCSRPESLSLSLSLSGGESLYVKLIKLTSHDHPIRNYPLASMSRGMSRGSSWSDEEEVSQSQCSTHETEHGDSDLTNIPSRQAQEDLNHFQEQNTSHVVDDENHIPLSSLEHQGTGTSELPEGVFYYVHPSSDGAGSFPQPPEDVIPPSRDDHSTVQEAYSDLPFDLHGSYRSDDEEVSLGGYNWAHRQEGDTAGEYDLHPSILGRYGDGFPPIQTGDNQNESEARFEGNCSFGGDETSLKTVDRRQCETQDDLGAEATETESSEESSESGSYLVEPGQLTNLSSFYGSMPTNINVMIDHSEVMTTDPDVMTTDLDAVVPQGTQQNVCSTFTSTGYQTASVDECGDETSGATGMQTVVKMDDRQADLHSETTTQNSDHDQLSPLPIMSGRQGLIRQISCHSQGHQDNFGNEPIENSDDEDRTYN